MTVGLYEVVLGVGSASARAARSPEILFEEYTMGFPVATFVSVTSTLGAEESYRFQDVPYQEYSLRTPLS